MARKTKHTFAKRQRELTKKKKKEDKEARRGARKAGMLDEYSADGGDSPEMIDPDAPPRVLTIVRPKEPATDDSSSAAAENAE